MSDQTQGDQSQLSEVSAKVTNLKNTIERLEYRVGILERALMDRGQSKETIYNK